MRPAPTPIRLRWPAHRSPVVKSFKKRTVVRGVSLELRRGEAVGLLGPNGAGKTTVFYMITGLIPSRRRLDQDRRPRRDQAADVSPRPARHRLSAAGSLDLPRASRSRRISSPCWRRSSRTSASARRSSMRCWKSSASPACRTSPAMRLSGGERRRVEIARALATRPSFMLLDEPFAGIDPIAVNDIRALVRHLTQRGIGVLITDHNVRETLDLVGRAYIIHDGMVLTHGTAARDHQQRGRAARLSRRPVQDLSRWRESVRQWRSPQS